MSNDDREMTASDIEEEAQRDLFNPALDNEQFHAAWPRAIIRLMAARTLRRTQEPVEAVLSRKERLEVICATAVEVGHGPKFAGTFQMAQEYLDGARTDIEAPHKDEPQPATVDHDWLQKEREKMIAPSRSAPLLPEPKKNSNPGD